MKGTLAQRTVVITGAASGLGRAWTQGFLADGATIVAADIDADGLRTLEGVHRIETDVTDNHAVKAMVDFALEKTGRIDVLFNNAGVGFYRSIEELEDGQFEHHVAIHLFGVVSGMRYAIPPMREQGYGRIINTVSRAAEFATAKNSAYAAAKAGIWSATRSAAKETEDTDILINMLIPGPTNTGIWGRDRPKLQAPSVTYPTARMLATLPRGGANATVFWNEREYGLFDPVNRGVG